MTGSPNSAVRVRYPLRWRDMDGLGHLNQAVYHELLEDARAQFVARLGPIEEADFVLARVELDYRHEVRRADEHVDVITRAVSAGRSSVTLEHRVVLADDTLCAEGVAVLVAWDAEARGSRPLSDRERAGLDV